VSERSTSAIALPNMVGSSATDAADSSDVRSVKGVGFPYSWASRSERVIWWWFESRTRQISVTFPSFQPSSSGVRKLKSSRESSNFSPT
jgi:hypothetical protein